MANEVRVRQNFISGVVDDNPLAIGATTLNSTALSAMMAIGSKQHAVIILDPDGASGAPEIVYVTAHTSSATSATILRGREGTTARQHNQNTVWRHGPTKRDFFDSSLGRASASVSPGGAYDDEFDDGVRDAAWVEVQRGTDTNSFTERYGMTVYRHTDQAGGNRDLHALVRPYTVQNGDYIETLLDFTPVVNYMGVGLIMADGVTFGAGNQIVLWRFSGTMRLQGMTNYNASGGDGTGAGIPNSVPLFMRLKQEAANTYGSYWSRDGFEWRTIQTNYAKTFSPTYIGIMAIHWDNPAPLAAMADWHGFWLNRVNEPA